MPEYEIYALKYAGPRRGLGAVVMWNQDWDKIFERSFYIWCLKGPDGPIVVDAGTKPDLAIKNELPGYVGPVEVLSALGVEADEVKHLILTHLHWDHANGVSLFPNAKVYVQEQEYEFWANDPLAKRPLFSSLVDAESINYLIDLQKKERLVLLKGDREIFPGIECLLAPGHTVGLQVVAVSTKKGTAIVCSDCAHIFRNYHEDWPSIFITDLRAWLKSYDKLRERVFSPDLVFPGHDILMTSNYPAVAPNVTRLV